MLTDTSHQEKTKASSVVRLYPPMAEDSLAIAIKIVKPYDKYRGLIAELNTNPLSQSAQTIVFMTFLWNLDGCNNPGFDKLLSVVKVNPFYKFVESVSLNSPPEVDVAELCLAYGFSLMMANL